MMIVACFYFCIFTSINLFYEMQQLVTRHLVAFGNFFYNLITLMLFGAIRHPGQSVKPR